LSGNATAEGSGRHTNHDCARKLVAHAKPQHSALCPERHELYRLQSSLDQLAINFSNEPQVLIAGADRNDAASAFTELIEKCARHCCGGGGGKDGVERRAIAKRGDAVADRERDVRDVESIESRENSGGKIGFDLRAVNMSRDARQNRRLISAAGSDLEDAFVASQLEKLRHQRDDVGLRNRLSAL